MSITYLEQTGIWWINTKRTSYAIKQSHGFLIHLYYGRRIPNEDISCAYAERPNVSFYPYLQKIGTNFLPNSQPQEFSCAGWADFRETAVCVGNAYGDGVTQFTYRGFKVYQGGPESDLPQSRGGETLEFELYDGVSDCELFLSFTAHEDSDTICRAARVRNRGDNRVSVRKLLSFQLDLPGGDYDAVTLCGAYGRERWAARRPITPGVFAVGSRRGETGHQHNPFLAVCARGAGEQTGEVYAAELVYSGNFTMKADCDEWGGVRVLGGISPESFSWELQPGETFCAPEAILTFSCEGLGGMSRNLHRHLRNHVIPEEFAFRSRPVVLNSWEAVYFDINEELLLAFASEAGSLGADMLVVDDGWFGERDLDVRGLGDWYANAKKFPQGLAAFSRKIHALGLKFGIWIEPEMVNEDSDLYRRHPDWVLGAAGRERSLGREQLVLDFANPAVCDHIFRQLTETFRGVELEYIKWDMNRSLTEPGSAWLPPDRQGEVYHRYVQGVYSLYKRLREALPGVLIEGCSGGGGRFDAGILSFSPQIWTSDDTCPYERIEIQYGTSLAYPLSAISNHVTNTPNGGTNRLSSLTFRYLVASGGAYGYELNVLKMSEEDKQAATELTARYRAIEQLILCGDLYRLEKTEAAYAYAVVSQDKSRFVLTYLQKTGLINPPLRRVRLAGLNADAVYRSEDGSLTLSGAALMNVGLVVPALFGDGQGWQIVFTALENQRT